MEQKMTAVKSYILYFSALAIFPVLVFIFLRKNISQITANSLMLSFIAGSAVVLISFLVLVRLYEKSNTVFFGAFFGGMIARILGFVILGMVASSVGGLDFITVVVSLALVYFYFLVAEIIFLKTLLKG